MCTHMLYMLVYYCSIFFFMSNVNNNILWNYDDKHNKCELIKYTFYICNRYIFKKFNNLLKKSAWPENYRDCSINNKCT